MLGSNVRLRLVLHRGTQHLVLTPTILLDIVALLHGALNRNRLRLKREPGANPELPRSG